MEPGKIPAEEEILAGRGEILGGRGEGPGRQGGRPLSGRGGGWAAPGRPPGELEFPPPGASVGGTTLVAPNGPKRSQNRRFPEGADPAPPAGIPAPLGGADWLHGVRFRVLLELRCSLTDAQSASGAKSGLPRGG